MFLTRLGFGAKAVITGDITQIDLPAGRTSGLVEAMKVVGSIEGISFIYFDDRDVVRHKLVQQIVKAYERFSNGSSARPSSARDPYGRPEEAGVAASPSRADPVRSESPAAHAGSGGPAGAPSPDPVRPDPARREPLEPRA